MQRVRLTVEQIRQMLGANEVIDLGELPSSPVICSYTLVAFFCGRRQYLIRHNDDEKLKSFTPQDPRDSPME